MGSAGADCCEVSGERVAGFVVLDAASVNGKPTYIDCVLSSVGCNEVWRADLAKRTCQDGGTIVGRQNII